MEESSKKQAEINPVNPQNDLQADTKDDLDNIIEPNKLQAIVSLLKAEISTGLFSSPFPPPEILEKYKILDPELIEIVKDNVKKEQDHRHSLNNKMVDYQHTETTRGQNRGYQIALFSIIAAVIAMFLHEDGVAIACMGAGVSNVVLAFLGKREKEKLNQKNDDE